MEFKVISSEDMYAITTGLERLRKDVGDIVKKAHNPLQENWLDNQDACRILKVGTRTLQNYRDNGTLPYSNLGGKVFYKASDIEAVLDSNYKVKKQKL